MKGKITLEEAYMSPQMAARELKDNKTMHIHPDKEEEWQERIVNIARKRLEDMEKYGVGYSVMSLTIPGIQGIWNQKEAEAEATETNDWIADEIKNHRDKLGAFACLSMHDPKQAAEELRRCVTKYGFHGALLNDFQLAGKNGTDYLYYDQPAYDPFWEVVQELDVPVYIHPRGPSDDIVFEKQYKERKWVAGPAFSFATGVALHILGMITNGVFDRFPKLKIIIGHLGERIPIDFWRINMWFEDVEKPYGMAAKKTLAQYFNENIWITTSSNFSTPALKFCIDQLGVDRIMFSVDSPYMTYHDGCTWFDDHANLSLEEKVKIGRSTAKTLLKIGDYADQDVPVTE